MNTEDRQKVIDGLFGELSQSAFAEGCEDKIARALEAKSDSQLIAMAEKHLTWLPVKAPVKQEPVPAKEVV